MTGDYRDYDALGLADLVQRGEVSPQDLLEAAATRASEVNPRINAVITPMYEEARRVLASGELPAGPFAGVPFLLKDLMQPVAGVPMSGGSRALRDTVPTEESELVRRFRRTGLVFAGKTNTPELGLLAITEPVAFGPCRNPWNPDRTPGGSSGGAAAAVAAGIVPMASASDGGGSIRIPASHCGLFGFKPSRRRVPPGVDHLEGWDGAVVDHVVTRSVRDSAAMLDCLGSGVDMLAPPETPYLQLSQREPGPLRVALDVSAPLGTPVSPECVAAVYDAGELLEGLGHHVEERSPYLDGELLTGAYLTMYYGQVAAEAERIRRQYGVRASRLLEPETRALAAIGRAVSAAEYVLARWAWGELSTLMEVFHRDFDVYVTPTTASPPVRIGELAASAAERVGMRLADRLNAGKLLRASGIAEKLARENLAKTPFTQLANLTGQPAMSVPLYWSKEALPVGVQFMAPLAREDVLFQLAGQLERARPWFDRLPPEPEAG